MTEETEINKKMTKNTNTDETMMRDKKAAAKLNTEIKEKNR